MNTMAIWLDNLEKDAKSIFSGENSDTRKSKPIAPPSKNKKRRRD